MLERKRPTPASGAVALLKGSPVSPRSWSIEYRLFARDVRTSFYAGRRLTGLPLESLEVIMDQVLEKAIEQER
jgi:hypothetical protein